MTETRQAGDLFAALFRELYPRLCRFLAAMLGDTGRAEEIAQETLLRLYRSSMLRRPEEEVRRWVFRVGRNMALNDRKHLAVVQRSAVLYGPAEETPSPTPEQRFGRKQDLGRLWELMGALPEIQRAALLLREHEQMTYEQIAGVLNISLSNVKVSIFRARKSLREGWRGREQETRREVNR